MLGAGTGPAVAEYGRHPRPGNRCLPRSGDGRCRGHDARVPPPRCAAAPDRHEGRWSLCVAARCLDRRHGHGAGARRQPRGYRDPRRSGPDGPLHEVVAERRVFVHRHLLRHRQCHPRGARPVLADRGPDCRLDRAAQRRQRLADAARPRSRCVSGTSGRVSSKALPGSPGRPTEPRTRWTPAGPSRSCWRMP